MDSRIYNVSDIVGALDQVCGRTVRIGGVLQIEFEGDSIGIIGDIFSAGVNLSGAAGDQHSERVETKRPRASATQPSKKQETTMSKGMSCSVPLASLVVGLLVLGGSAHAHYQGGSHCHPNCILGKCNPVCHCKGARGWYTVKGPSCGVRGKVLKRKS